MKLSHLGTTALICCLPATSFALNINLVPAAGMSQDAIDGFQAAADYWESVLTDNVTVNVDIDFAALGAGVLGSAGSTTQSVSVSDYFAALGGDATSTIDATAVANLPGLSGAGGLTYITQIYSPAGGGTMVLGTDSDDSGNNRILNLNTSTAKAVGLFTGGAGDSDASITFSSSFTWDFDNSDGVDAGHQDFVGVAIHELGHSLGFRSGVDTVDFVMDNPQSLENFRVWSGLDMFRFSADGVHDLSVGTASYFSVDGGTTNLGLFSTGSSNGDGNQASHWKDNLGLGIMDPTANPAGQTNTVTMLDLQAFDVMGWDMAVPAPEPSTGALLLGSAIAMLGFRRRS
ncbi:MAG: PEP-CTERM sorting domain-containing protein [Akkermansiaceae bacterium]|nr:PEP-CTERM sorting domain-containing protein [Akkermansiaceae bacterium]